MAGHFFATGSQGISAPPEDPDPQERKRLKKERKKIAKAMAEFWRNLHRLIVNTIPKGSEDLAEWVLGDIERAFEEWARQEYARRIAWFQFGLAEGAAEGMDRVSARANAVTVASALATSSPPPQILDDATKTPVIPPGQQITITAKRDDPIAAAQVEFETCDVGGGWPIEGAKRRADLYLRKLDSEFGQKIDQEIDPPVIKIINSWGSQNDQQSGSLQFQTTYMMSEAPQSDTSVRPSGPTADPVAERQQDVGFLASPDTFVGGILDRLLQEHFRLTRPDVAVEMARAFLSGETDVFGREIPPEGTFLISTARRWGQFRAGVEHDVFMSWLPENAEAPSREDFAITGGMLATVPIRGGLGAPPSYDEGAYSDEEIAAGRRVYGDALVPILATGELVTTAAGVVAGVDEGATFVRGLGKGLASRGGGPRSLRIPNLGSQGEIVGTARRVHFSAARVTPGGRPQMGVVMVSEEKLGVALGDYAFAGDHGALGRIEFGVPAAGERHLGFTVNGNEATIVPYTSTTYSPTGTDVPLIRQALRDPTVSAGLQNAGITAVDVMYAETAGLPAGESMTVVTPVWP
jgi:hypothetical protein